MPGPRCEYLQLNSWHAPWSLAAGSPWKVPWTYALKLEMTLWTSPSHEPGEAGSISRARAWGQPASAPAAAGQPSVPTLASGLTRARQNALHDAPEQSATALIEQRPGPPPRDHRSTATSRGWRAVPLPAVPGALAPR